MQDTVKLWIYTKYLTVRKFLINLKQYIEHARCTAEEEAKTKMANGVPPWIHGNAAFGVLATPASEEDYNDIFIPAQSQVHADGDGYFINIVNTSDKDKTINWSIYTRSHVKSEYLVPPTFDEGEDNGECD